MEVMLWLLLLVSISQGLAMKVKSEAELQTMLEREFLGSVKINCADYPANTSIRYQFNAPYFSNRFYRIPHDGSIAITANGDILIRSVISEPSSPKTILCFKHFDDVDSHSLDDDVSKLRLSSVRRLVPFVTEIWITGSSTFLNLSSIVVFKSARTLGLDNLGLKFIPEFILNFPLLTTLSLPNNNLTSVPPSILNLRYLTHLTMDNNPRLSSLEGISGHPSLKSLTAQNCAIERLPTALPQLTHLYLSNNRLSTMDGIETLGYGNDQEQSFFLDRNRIESVPDEISSVKNLSTLNLNSNRLFEIPASIIDIPSLRRLYIEKNCFESDVLVDMVSELNITHPKMTFKHNNQRPSSKGVCPEN